MLSRPKLDVGDVLNSHMRKVRRLQLASHSAKLRKLKYSSWKLQKQKSSLLYKAQDTSKFEIKNQYALVVFETPLR